MTFSAAIRQDHLPALTGLRALFVAVVVAYHAGVPVPAGIGVTGFFVLSGFLITTLLLKEFDRTGEVSLVDFYRRRTLRIFPAYYAFLGLSIGADLALGNDSATAVIVPGILYFVNYHNAFHGHDSSIAHAWSLAIEEQFYLIWPLVFMWLGRKHRRAMPWILGAFILAIMCWRSFAVGLFGSSYAYNAFDTRCDSLAVGCLLAVLAPRLDVVAAKVARVWLIPPVLLLIWLSNLGAVRYTFGFTLCSIMLGVLIMQAMTLHKSNALAWLESRPVTYIGSISYGIYLYHMFGLSVGHALFDGSFAIATGIVAMLSMAVASYHLYEKPLMALGKRAPKLSVGMTVPAQSR